MTVSDHGFLKSVEGVFFVPFTYISIFEQTDWPEAISHMVHKQNF